MKKAFMMTIALLCAVAQGAWAESVTFNVRSWDATNKQVVTTSTTKDCTVLTGNPGEWMMLGSSSDQNDHYYVVKGNVSYQTLNVFGKAHLILADGATLTLTGGLKVEAKNNNAQLFIYSQSDGDSEGRLVVTNSYSDTSGIGSARDSDCGSIEIHGGNLDVTGGEYGAGIGTGGCLDRDVSAGTVTVFGGMVKAQGGERGAGIGGGRSWKKLFSHGGVFTLYGGTVNATGGQSGAGIGGGGAYLDLHGGNGGKCYVYGGTLTAQGGTFAAGIGSGRHDDESDFVRNDGEVRIEGGTVNATGGKYGAGIGGGKYSSGGTITISGSTTVVNAKGGTDGAGIGGGERSIGGIINICGGTVRAEGSSYGSGIGGGEEATGANLTITGGTIIAIAGNDCKGREANGGSAIGSGRGIPNKGSNYVRPLSLPDNYRVTAGDAENNIERVFTAGERIDACRWRNYVKIEACDHTTPTVGSDQTATPRSYIFDDDSHTLVCRYCSETETSAHNYFSTNTCICGRPAEPSDIPVSGQFWFQDGVYPTGSQRMPTGFYNLYNGNVITLPMVNNIDGLQFMGYLVNSGWPTSIEMQAGEEASLLKGGEVFTIDADKAATFIGKKSFDYYARFLYVFEPEWTWADDGSTASVTLSNPKLDDVTLSSTDDDPKVTITQTDLKDGSLTIGTRYTATATYSVGTYVYTFTDNKDILTALDITLSDNAANDETLANHDEHLANVTLSGRTLWKDGSWNTLCLPFDVATFDGTPLEGATVKTLSSSSFDDGTLTLNFTDASSIEAGKPYLVKWTSGSNVANPVFSGMTINDKYDMVECDHVNFIGNTSPFTLEAGDKTVLYLGSDNKLYYPTDKVTVGSCRAVFQLHNGLTAGDLPVPGQAAARRFVLNFGDGNESTGILSLPTDSKDAKDNAAWYTLDGRRLTGKPTTKGLYINNGKKIVIK